MPHTIVDWITLIAEVIVGLAVVGGFSFLFYQYKETKQILLIGIVIGLVGLCLFFVGTTSMIILTEVIIFILLMIPLIIGIAWKTGYLATLFTTIESGSCKFIDAGETNVITYINIPGKVLKNGEIVDGDPEITKSYIQKRFGQYWVGFKFLGRRVHTFPLVKERISQELRPGMDPSEWIDRDSQAINATELRWKFPRPVLVPEVELTDRIEANILVLCKLEVLRPNVPIYIQKGGFFAVLVDYVRSGVMNYCQQMSYVEFVQADKLDGGVMSCQIVTAINAKIEAELGIRLTGLAVSIYDSAKPEDQIALEAAELARLNGLATVATAEAVATALIVTTTAENKKTVMDATALAEADTILGQASVVDVLATADHFSTLGADPNIAAQTATALGRAKRFADSKSPVTTLVDGQSNIALPLPTKAVVLARN